MRTQGTSQSVGRNLLSKVPEVTIYFWIIKVLATTVGETAADFLNTTLHLGLTWTTVVMTAALVVGLVLQFRARVTSRRTTGTSLSRSASSATTPLCSGAARPKPPGPASASRSLAHWPRPTAPGSS